MVISIVRTFILYLLVIGALRLMGKRQVGELEPSELVVAIMISELAAVPMQDFSIPLLHGIVPILVLMALEILLSAWLLKSIRLRSILCGHPSILVENGNIVQSELKRNRITVDELIEELRLQNQTDISHIKYAILETSGRLSVLPYAEYMPVTSGEIASIHSSAIPETTGLPMIIISDGKLLSNNMNLRGLRKEWLDKQFESLGIKSMKDVFLMIVDDRNKIYYLPKEKAV